jgi:Flp pilus assembly pilin Flp
MREISRTIRNLHHDDQGQDTLEYVFIGLIVALGSLAGMSTLAKSLNSEFTRLAGDLT